MKQILIIALLLALSNAHAQSTYERIIVPPGDPDYVKHLSAAVAPDGRTAMLDQLYAGYAITLFDDSLRQLWSLKIKRGSILTTFAPWHTLFLANGDLFLCGDVFMNNGFNLAVMRIDVNGNVLWDRMYHAAEYWGHGFGEPTIVAMPDGGVTILARKSGWAADINEVLSLIRLDQLGNVLWTESLSSGGLYYSGLPKADVAPNGDLLVGVHGSLPHEPFHHSHYLLP